MKRKVVNRLLSVSMATVMTVGLAGCGGNDAGTAPEDAGSTPAPQEDNQSSNDQAEVEEPDVDAGDDEEEVGQYTVLTDENGNVYDLGGIEVQIRNWWYSEREPSTAFQEDQAAYREWAQETYNFTVKEVSMGDWGTNHEDFQNYVTSGGDDNNYVFTLHTGSAILSMMGNDQMYDLSTLDCLDFNEYKWTRNGLHTVYTNPSTGAIYACSPNPPEPRAVVFFNKRLLQEAGINPDDIYKDVEAGNWDFDKFEEYCKQITADTDNDGVIDRYAMVVEDSVFKKGAAYANGGAFVKRENGKYVNGLEDQATLDGLNWAIDMMTNYNNFVEGDNWDYFVPKFQQGQAAFCVSEFYAIQPGNGKYDPDSMETKDDIGIAPFPKGWGQSKHISTAADNLFVIPGCYDADRAWKVAFALNQYTASIPGYEGYNELLDQYYGQVYDSESVDISLPLVMEGEIPTYIEVIPGIDIGGADFLWNVGVGAPAAPAAEAVRDKLNAQIEKANAGIMVDDAAEE